jgi:condensin complex subunit 2
MAGGHMDDDDEDFADAREAFSPGPDDPNAQPVPPPPNPSSLNSLLQLGGINGVEFGSQLVTSSRRVRPEYVQYAKIAKKVDVRKLKEKLWDVLAFSGQQVEDGGGGQQEEEGGLQEERKFTRIMNGLQDVYPQKAMADISTSYCFICLLHLANEKGLVIAGNETLTELSVKRDLTAEGPDEF